MKHMNRLLIPVVLVGSIAVFLLRCSAREPGIYARIYTSEGKVTARLAYKKAPLTSANFVGLAEGTIPNSATPKEEPFYDGLTFHRIVPGFVIQGGDPRGDGTGGPGYRFRDEFHPELRHDEKGVLSMANSGPHSNGSQFFITLKPTPNLNDRHSVFGKVVEGLNILDSIVAYTRNAGPGSRIRIDSIRIDRVGGNAKKFKEGQQPEFDTLIAIARKNMNATQRSDKETHKMVKKKWPDAKRTDSGLMYIVESEGKGEATPQKGDDVKVHYVGRLLNGKTFDNSYERRTPARFKVGVRHVIKGWDEALLDMKKGEKRTLIIPPKLAYGSSGRGPIPPNSWLVFEVELLDF